MAAHRRIPSVTLAVTAGDPCGVGPEVILKALHAPLPPSCRLMVIGDRGVFAQAARMLRLRLPPWVVVSSTTRRAEMHAPLVLVDCAQRRRFVPGRTSRAAGAAALRYLDLAIALCQQGRCQGLVTAPVTKWSAARAHPIFVGHTEYLAEALGAPCPVMMFASPRLRVVLMTRHVRLRDVPVQATQQLVRATTRVTMEGLSRWFGIRRPRMAVCGLNPHAGERGLLGDEERRVLLPVLRECTRKGMRLEGPFAADGFFANLYGPHCAGRDAAGGYDAVLCWYHDQGLIPFKLMVRDLGCQVTLGLPMIRTSPDHGSALDIAGKGLAHPGSMRYALQLASELARRAIR